jgi:hypothetical protein
VAFGFCEAAGPPEHGHGGGIKESAPEGEKEWTRNTKIGFPAFPFYSVPLAYCFFGSICTYYDSSRLALHYFFFALS